MNPPAFWLRDGPTARLLEPLGRVYDAAGRLRWRWSRREPAPVPVICVGNASVGGTGKTPIVIDLLTRLRRRGIEAHGLCRGHGGRPGGPVRVDREHHDASAVGDEALLLARVGPTWAGRDRLAAARMAAAAGAQILVLDDGLQYPRLVKQAGLLVVDAETGFGNGRIVPAGPLREPVVRTAARVDAAVVVGPDTGRVAGLPAAFEPPWRCRLVPAAGSERLAGRRVLAFCGIGRPQKFFTTARALGCDVVTTRAFADHHRFRPRELRQLREAASRLDAALLTTAKDAVRLPAAFRGEVEVLDVNVAWADAAQIDAWLSEYLPSR